MSDDAVQEVELFGLPVRAETLAQAVDRIEARVRERRPTIHVVLNAAKVSKIARDPQFLDLMRRFDMIHADGASVVWASRLLGRPLPERVAGIDLMLALVERAASKGLRVFLLGARQEVVTRAAETLRARHPGLAIAGTHHGYWTEGDPAEEGAVVDAVRNAKADLLFVAMPTPRKEVFLARHKEELGVPFAMGVGGAFDVICGLVKRAPPAWQRAGMEWAYRLLQEPRKMWRRYLVTNSHFLWLLARAMLRERLLPKPPR